MSDNRSFFEIGAKKQREIEAYRKRQDFGKRGDVRAIILAMAFYGHQQNSYGEWEECQFCETEHHNGIWHTESCPVHRAQNILIRYGYATEDDFGQRNYTPPPPTAEEIISKEALAGQVLYMLYRTDESGKPIQKIGTFADFWVNMKTGKVGVIEIVKRLNDSLSWQKPYNPDVEVCVTEQAPGYMVKRVQL